ncbi:hypothetical protein F4V43_02375 [Paenibacillus spiritus]|uniref:Uncharacterized protein n=1 Tax=Paenibacillus spiritus TaxID=2496557 RepID=A0A5J5GI19_9BACL|nr:hypothetical protein [Paenibacillus spiritus]KAA9007352.1 hypothetical protein F4V43_02375 [Paenibacillus spiritus]
MEQMVKFQKDCEEWIVVKVLNQYQREDLEKEGFRELDSDLYGDDGYVFTYSQYKMFLKKLKATSYDEAVKNKSRYIAKDVGGGKIQIASVMGDLLGNPDWVEVVDYDDINLTFESREAALFLKNIGLAYALHECCARQVADDIIRRELNKRDDEDHYYTANIIWLDSEKLLIEHTELSTWYGPGDKDVLSINQLCRLIEFSKNSMVVELAFAGSSYMAVRIQYDQRIMDFFHSQQ